MKFARIVPRGASMAINNFRTTAIGLSIYGLRAVKPCPYASGAGGDR